MESKTETRDIDFPADYTVVDIETTGLSSTYCEIIELSALKVKNHVIVDEFSALIKPSKNVNSFISNLTGITNDMLEDAALISEVLPDFIKFISDDIILGHNIKFDIGFINHNCKKHMDSEFNNDFVDTMRISRRYCTFASHKLQSLAKHYKIDITGHHRALNDCKITHKIYLKLKEEFHCPPVQQTLI